MKLLKELTTVFVFNLFYFILESSSNMICTDILNKSINNVHGIQKNSLKPVPRKSLNLDSSLRYTNKNQNNEPSSVNVFSMMNNIDIFIIYLFIIENQ